MNIEPVDILLYFNFNCFPDKILFVVALRLTYFKPKIQQVNLVLVQPRKCFGLGNGHVKIFHRQAELLQCMQEVFLSVRLARYAMKYIILIVTFNRHAYRHTIASLKPMLSIFEWKVEHDFARLVTLSSDGALSNKSVVCELWIETSSESVRIGFDRSHFIDLKTFRLNIIKWCNQRSYKPVIVGFFQVFGITTNFLLKKGNNFLPSTYFSKPYNFPFNTIHAGPLHTRYADSLGRSSFFPW